MKHCGTSSSRERHDHARRQICNIVIAGFALATVSLKLAINSKTVVKWRKREAVEDRKTGPKEADCGPSPRFS